MGAAWRQAPQGREFDSVLQSVRAVAALDMEVCCTLGMLTESQAAQLKEAGFTAYNHNLDSSPEFYSTIRFLSFLCVSKDVDVLRASVSPW
jgi:biotin synthase